MNLFKKTYWLIYPALIIFFMFLFDQVYQTDTFLLKAIISGVAAFLVSPRKKKIKTETGEKFQITWIFLKQPIELN